MTFSDSCSCGWDGPGNHCWLCHTTEPSAARLIAHMLDEHGISIVGAAVETWPDGEPVIVDLTLEPEDFRT